MKQLIVVVLALLALNTNVFAWDADTVAATYLNDSAMTSFAANLSADPGYRHGYCGEVGKNLFNQYGSAQPVLFELGIPFQTAETYKAACFTVAAINDRMSANDARAMSYILASMLEADMVNKAEVPLGTIFSIVNWLDSDRNNDFGPYNTIRSFVNLSQGHPNGLPERAKEFFQAVFDGRINSAMNALAKVHPTGNTMQVLASNFNVGR